jgi:hypothetical protein
MRRLGFHYPLPHNIADFYPYRQTSGVCNNTSVSTPDFLAPFLEFPVQLKSNARIPTLHNFTKQVGLPS